MAASYEEIKSWIERAEPDDTHLIIVCDGWNNDDFPVFVKEGQDVSERIDHYKNQKMYRVMEVYNLKKDVEAQLNEPIAWHP